MLRSAGTHAIFAACFTSSAYDRCHEHIGVGAGQGGRGTAAGLVRLILAHMCRCQLQKRERPPLPVRRRASAERPRERICRIGVTPELEKAGPGHGVEPGEVEEVGRVTLLLRLRERLVGISQGSQGLPTFAEAARDRGAQRKHPTEPRWRRTPPGQVDGIIEELRSACWRPRVDRHDAPASKRPYPHVTVAGSRAVSAATIASNSVA